MRVGMDCHILEIKKSPKIGPLNVKNLLDAWKIKSPNVTLALVI